jgi:hypothetical protein
MNVLFQPLRVAAFLVPWSAAWAAAPAAAQSDVDKVAVEVCEKEVTESVQQMRGRQAQEVQFVGSKRAVAPGSGEEIGIKGEGRYRGASGTFTAFTYSCAYSPETRATTGVLFSDKGGAARAAPGKPWQPDLTSVSPEACERATAIDLKQKYPRVERITFGSDSRQLRAAPNERNSLLEGQGALARAAGMNAVPFTYRCEFDTRSGQVVGVQTRD